MEKFKSVIEFNKYVIEKIIFTVNKNYKPSDNINLEVQFKYRFDYKSEERIAVIELGCNIFKDLKENHPFSLEVELIGFFKYAAELEKEQLEMLLKVNGTAILFPYLRSIVSIITVNSGFDPIILPVINVHKVFEQDNKSG